MLPASATTSQVGGDFDGQAVGDWLGYNVSLSNDGSRVAVGAPQVDGTESKAGYVRVYDLVGGSWSQVGADINGEAAGDQSGYWVSLSSDGSRVAIGAPQNDGNGSGAGHVRVYDLVDGSWSQVGGDIDGEAAGDLSGRAVSLSSDGSRLAIGASGSDGNGSDAGHVRVYDLVDGSWSQVGADIAGEAAGAVSGGSDALSSDGSRVAIGAPQNDGNGSGAGHVRVYDLVGGSWSQVGADIDGEAAGDEFGYRVALSADASSLAVGAPLNDGNGTDAGHVRVYDLVDGSWSQVGADIDGEAAGDFSGSAVALSSGGSRVVIGAHLNDGSGVNTGHVRVYDLVDGSWSQVGADIDGEASDAEVDQSGHSVAISGVGDRIAIGALGNDGAAADAGHTRVFELASTPPTTTTTTAPTTTTTTTVAGVSSEGPAYSVTDTNMTGNHWLQLDEQLGAGQRLVLSGAFLADLAEDLTSAIDGQIWIGLPSSTWSNTAVASVSDASMWLGGVYIALTYHASSTNPYGLFVRKGTNQLHAPFESVDELSSLGGAFIELDVGRQLQNWYQPQDSG